MPEPTELPDCDAMEAEVARLASIAAERRATVLQTLADAERLDTELLELARSWGGDTFAGTDWRDYQQQLMEGLRDTGRALDALEGEDPPRDPEEIRAEVDAAWEELSRLSDAYVDLLPQWESAMAQISGDQPTDMSHPLGDLMAHANRLREELDRLDAAIQAGFSEIQSLNAELADAENAPADLQRARDEYAAAEEASTRWEEASADLKEERNGLHPDVAAEAAARDEAKAFAAAATYERKCWGDAEEPEGDDGWGDGDDTGLE